MLAAVAIIVASVNAVSDNGLGFTAAAEMAGPLWSGRALGAQNTAQFAAAAAAPPLLGILIAGSGFTAGFALTALAPVIAIPLIPVRAEGAGATDTPND